MILKKESFTEIKAAVQYSMTQLSTLKIEAQESGRIVQIFNALNRALNLIKDSEDVQLKEKVKK